MTEKKQFLYGLISKDDVKKKGRHNFMDWAQTRYYMETEAPGWRFHCSEIKKAPNGTGYVDCYFDKSGVQFSETEIIPYACMDNQNKAIPYDKCDSRVFTDTHRRAYAFCCAWSFGLALELWQGLDPNEFQSGITVNPQKATGLVESQPVTRKITKEVPAADKIAKIFHGQVLEGEALEREIEEVDGESPLDSEERLELLNEIKSLFTGDTNKYYEFDDKFRKHFKYKGTKTSDGIQAVKHKTFFKEFIAA